MYTIYRKSPLTLAKLVYKKKSLNFCPSSNDINKEELLYDIFSYCRNIRLKHHFDTSNRNHNSTDSSITELRLTEFDKRCKMKSTYKNPYFYPSSNFTPPNSEMYLAATKMNSMKLAETQSQTATNLTSSERQSQTASNLTSSERESQTASNLTSSERESQTASNLTSSEREKQTASNLTSSERQSQTANHKLHHKLHQTYHLRKDNHKLHQT